ncbi:syntaxin binding protein 1 [Coniosporium tulheliwenetii]|uniref:Syntaxin binding protein 1 n=1 Tax=Coniosporium tulheliwenetii TaxID=3383036 RepID=A0ACC2ZA58_9PEZI|nr:syntaxin binding protein 1 [Cladosporium sp. JES 115]
MGVSIIDTLREIILKTIQQTARGEWMVFVVDETSRKLIDNVVKEDEILSQNITNIEQIENKRPLNREMDAIYILSPQPYVVDCFLADLERRRYRRPFLIWTSIPHPALRERLDKYADRIALLKVVEMDFYPRESHLVTFRDPWSFPVLFHPACNGLVRDHMEALARKIAAVCISLGEYPTIRYYRPRNPTHEASVLCTHLARFVQDEIDMYAKFHQDFPPQTNRPRGALYITDRSMDLFAPFLHEFTYQAMAHDLLPIKDSGDKVIYKVIVNEGRPDQEEKEMDISEKDKIWVENRHRHMVDTIQKLMGDFQRFLDENPHFNNSDGNASSINAIKDMIAGLPQFQEMKEAYTLNLSMAQDCMNIFEHHKLPDVASLEQTLATGFDEDGRKPKALSETLIRTLDEEAVRRPDRLRLITLYLLYRNGLLPADLSKLLAHAQLPQQDAEMISNLELLGARYALSRFETNLKLMLENHVHGTLDQSLFPYTKPHLDASDTSSSASISSASLRSAKPTWAKSRLSSVEPRQRVIVFMAGGATYSESRACYEVSRDTSRDVFLVTSHMLTPELFMRQVGDLSVDKRRLGIPAEQPPRKAPAWVFEREEEPKPPPPQQQQKQALPKAPAPPMQAMGNLSLGGGAQRPTQNGQGSHLAAASGKGPAAPPEKEKKKKHHFFSLK